MIYRSEAGFTLAPVAELAIRSVRHRDSRLFETGDKESRLGLLDWCWGWGFGRGGCVLAC